MTSELTAQTDRPSQPRWQVKILAFALVLPLALAASELAAAIFYGVLVSPHLESLKADPGHYYRISENPLLGYELTPGFRMERDGRDLAINSLGLRGPGPAPSKVGPRLAILGDSVTFGIWQGEAQTIPHLMESKLRQECRTPVEVLNMGVPGYGSQELNELLKTKTPLLAPDGVIYLLNLNDFARRNTLWEGADAGLYRMYWPPTLKLPFLLQKALYRWEKGGKDDGMAPSLRWYRWLFNGTSFATFEQIDGMNVWAKTQGIGFAVSILPSGVALAGGSNALAGEHSNITTVLRAHDIAVSDDVRPYVADSEFFDTTDHLTAKGNDVASTQLIKVFKSVFPDLAARAGCKSSS